MSATEASQQANRAGMDPKRLVVIGYLVFGLVFALFLGNMLELAGARLGLGNWQIIDGLSESKWTNVLALVLTIGLGAFLWTNPKSKTVSLEIASELMRVTWPSWEETRVSTVAVVVASLIAAVVLFGIDTLSYKLIVDWLPGIWGKL
jgi:preprotein translocase subunit SecE